MFARWYSSELRAESQLLSHNSSWIFSVIRITWKAFEQHRFLDYLQTSLIRILGMGLRYMNCKKEEQVLLLIFWWKATQVWTSLLQNRVSRSCNYWHLGMTSCSGGCAVHYRMFGSIPGLYPLDTEAPFLPQVEKIKMSSHIAKFLWEGIKLPPF